MIKKTAFIIFVLVLVSLIMAPIAIYNYSISLLDNMPVRPESISVTRVELTKQWTIIEKNVEIEDVSNITPYWVYHWLVAGFLNDYFSYKSIDPYDSVSAMASEIAIHHMKISNTKTTNIFWRHMLHANLSIWLQRNWTPGEIFTKYHEI